jgi:hypothetical protein
MVCAVVVTVEIKEFNSSKGLLIATIELFKELFNCSKNEW